VRARCCSSARCQSLTSIITPRRSGVPSAAVSTVTMSRIQTMRPSAAIMRYSKV
jgi:hypothetical protein